VTDFKDHFSTLSREYARYRPRYPAELVARLAELSPDTRVAWDAGTGSGQAAIAMAGSFDRVYATDASAAQIAEAEPHPRVEYRVEAAEHSALATGSVSLVTVAQALHWFDRERFFAEVRRVSRPGAVLAVWTYGLARVQLPEGADEVFRRVARFYVETVGPFWPPERRFVEEGYSSIPFPFERLDVVGFAMRPRCNLDDFTGHIGTWSAVKRYREQVGADPVPALATELAPFFGDADTRHVVEWPLTVVCGRVS
jgi:SAM-dependent methyltransferase